MRAVAYLRVSGKAQVDGDGFPRQRAAIEAYAAVNGIEVVRWYEERGVSGTVEGADRPAWFELTEEAKRGKYVILIEKLDRLARDLMVQETILRDLNKDALILRSVAEPDLASTDATRVLMRQMMGAVAQYDKTTLVSKLKAARERKKRDTGRCEGIRPYGEYPGEAEVLEKIIEFSRAGMGYSPIARALNEMGIKPRSAKQWWPYTVSGILDLVAGRRQSDPVTEPVRRRRKRG